MMQQETWQETSLALGLENDILKQEIISLARALPLRDRRAAEVRKALLSCGLTEHEIELFVNGQLNLGD